VCGITGIFSHSGEAKGLLDRVKEATAAMHHRGPDNQAYFSDTHALFGHARLSIIDTSKASDQPFYSDDKRYVMVYNGEFFNYKEHRDALQKKGVALHTSGDTEVLLKLYITQGESFLENVNGFFAFAIYDTQEKSIFIARDRFGIKPLFYKADTSKLFFASEMKALLKYPIEKKLDQTSLLEYLQLTYVPAPYTMLEGVLKFPAGHCARLKPGQVLEFKRYCKEAYPQPTSDITYTNAKKTYYDLLDDAVQKRLIADVPLGTFLSGGLDSSAVSAIAAIHKPDLMTFSIGYKNEPVFDESYYAELVSKKLKTNHHTFMLDNRDLFDELFKVLDATDEPFGDSSAIPMHILSRKTRGHVTVALSGDAGDELMGGYNKHKAEFRVRNSMLLNPALMATAPFLKMLPQSRNSKLGNIARQGLKLAEGAGMNEKDRYWRWASFAKEQEVMRLLNPADSADYQKRKQEIVASVNSDFNSVLYTDVKLVLQNDMLVKVDTMSMANSLEVRSPLLDYRLVDFLFSLPVSYKISKTDQKKILRDSVAHLLPTEVINRKKHGFEVPLLKWFQNELKNRIENDWINDKVISEQRIFNTQGIKILKNKLYSNNPGDSVARIWALISFQNWHKKHMV
jgi:asparagine synthase (glutamine-hydrolysing)